MKKKQYTIQKIIGIMREAEKEGNIREVCRRHNLCEQTYHKWKRKYGDLEISEIRQLKELEQENRRLKKLVADLSIKNQILEEVNLKKW